MKNRVRHKADDLSREKSNILHFMMNECVPDCLSFEYTQDLFESYMKYRAKHHLDPTLLSVDGFGRLLPKNFKRKYICVRGHRGHAVIGVALVK